MSRVFLAAGLLLALTATVPAQTRPKPAVPAVTPLVIGDTFAIASTNLREKRRINVYVPQGYAESPELRLPVLYMPDGGIVEDFLHVAGLLQVSIGNGTMRPFLLVGIENTERRRDMTGPTESDGRQEDRAACRRVGGISRLHPGRADAGGAAALPDDRTRPRSSASRWPASSSSKRSCSSRICSTPTSPSTPAYGGTRRTFSGRRAAICGPGRRSGRRSSWPAAPSRGWRTSPRDWPGSSRRLRFPI